MKGHNSDSADHDYFFNHFHVVGGDDSLPSVAGPVLVCRREIQAVAVDAPLKGVGRQGAQPPLDKACVISVPESTPGTAKTGGVQKCKTGAFQGTVLKPQHGKGIISFVLQLSSILLKVCLPPGLISSTIYQEPKTQWVNSTRYLTPANCSSMSPALLQ